MGWLCLKLVWLKTAYLPLVSAHRGIIAELLVVFRVIMNVLLDTYIYSHYLSIDRITYWYAYLFNRIPLPVVIIIVIITLC